MALSRRTPMANSSITPTEGAKFASVRFTGCLDEVGARSSIAAIAASCVNTLAETTNGLYETERVYGPDAAGWDDVGQLELATFS
ncbi:MAG: hypothetical protein GY788_01095 [bacterium]|nr:hypothetical protein [bacterium]